MGETDSKQPDEHITEPELEEESIEAADPEMTDVGTAAAAKLKQLRAKLSACEDAKRQLSEDFQRNRADFLNARKRLTAEQEQLRERLTDDFILSLLPLCDSFEMAMKDTEAWDAVDENWRAGVEGIKQLLDRILWEGPLGAVLDELDEAGHDLLEAVLAEVDVVLDAGHLDGAINISHTRLLDRLDEVPADRDVYVHCRTGARAAAASALLEKHGRRPTLIDDVYGR